MNEGTFDLFMEDQLTPCPDYDGDDLLAHQMADAAFYSDETENDYFPEAE